MSSVHRGYAQEVAVTHDDRPFWETEKVPAKLVKRYERRYPFFKKIDLNKDWILQPQEIDKALKVAFKKGDANKSGLWERDELDKHRADFEENREESHGGFNKDRVKRYDQRMKQADKNEDGALSWEEYYKFFRARYYRMDNDGDEEVEFREFRTIDDKMSPSGGKDAAYIKVPALNE